jgi:putative endonuclease
MEPNPTALLGAKGETLAADFLIDKGYRIVVTNFTAPVGRNSRGVKVTGEIDIVALDGQTLCFVEVKTRVSDDFAPPSASVGRRKQRQIIRTARAYRRIFGVGEMAFRYDVVSIVIAHASEPRIELQKAFWSEHRFTLRNAARDIR